MPGDKFVYVTYIRTTCEKVWDALTKPGSKFIEGVSNGWPIILSNLKSLIETGKVFDRPDMVKKHAES